MKLPSIIGHRGAMAYAPENSISGIHTAADMGVKWVELDVRVTSDAEPVLFHDENMLRLTGLDQSIHDTNYKKLKELEIGSNFGESFIGEPIPHLEQGLEALLDRDLGLILDIKKDGVENPEETASIILDHLTRIWEDLDKLLISCSHPEMLEAMTDFAEKLPKTMGIKSADTQWEDAAQNYELSAVSIGGDEKLFNEVSIQRFKSKGLKVIC